MKWKGSAVVCAILYVFVYLVIAVTPALSLDQSELRPTSPPRIPVTDYGDRPHRIMDLMYLHYSFEGFSMDGGGLGFNYVSNVEQVGYNIGGGLLYMSGGDDTNTFDIDVWNLPLNANLGFRVLGEQDTHNMILFGGFHYTYTWIYITFDKYDIYVYGPAYGPLFGAKAQLKLSSYVSFIPYYVFQHTTFDYTVEVDGKTMDVPMDAVTSHLLGFDIQFGPFSVGALLDMLNNTDNDKITIMITYDFDYAASPRAENTPDDSGEDSARR